MLDRCDRVLGVVELLAHQIDEGGLLGENLQARLDSAYLYCFDDDFDAIV